MCVFNYNYHIYVYNTTEYMMTNNTKSCVDSEKYKVFHPSCVQLSVVVWNFLYVRVIYIDPALLGQHQQIKYSFCDFNLHYRKVVSFNTIYSCKLQEENI